jgi:uncharacterized iron-regulated membrane protein
MIKNIITKIHLWLGLASGIVVLVVSVTGCLYVFSQEISDWRRKSSIYTEQKSSTVQLAHLYKQVQAVMGPEKQISWVNVYNDPEKNWVFYTYKANPEALTYFGMIEYYESVFVDPYTGEIKDIYDEKNDFFNLVKMLHWSLLFNTSVGQPIVGWSTLIFVILLITGLVLWWPERLKGSKNSFRIHWEKPVRLYKKLYDLHNVLGFYCLLFALVIALTGMVWAFRWFEAAVYVAASGTTVPPDRSVMQSTPGRYAVTDPADLAMKQSRERYPDAYGFQLSLPADSTGVISIYVQQREGRYDVSHELQYDQYSGKLLKERKHSDKNAGEKLITANYDIHVGAIGGIPGKILAFLVSLICASLPVTGFLMWLNRHRKPKRRLVVSSE